MKVIYTARSSASCLPLFYSEYVKMFQLQTRHKCEAICLSLKVVSPSSHAQPSDEEYSGLSYALKVIYLHAVPTTAPLYTCHFQRKAEKPVRMLFSSAETCVCAADNFLGLLNVSRKCHYLGKKTHI